MATMAVVGSLMFLTAAFRARNRFQEPWRLMNTKDSRLGSNLNRRFAQPKFFRWTNNCSLIVGCSSSLTVQACDRARAFLPWWIHRTTERAHLALSRVKSRIGV